MRLRGPKKGVQTSHYFPFVLAVCAVQGYDSGCVGYKMTFLGLCGGIPRDMAAPITLPTLQPVGANCAVAVWPAWSDLSLSSFLNDAIGGHGESCQLWSAVPLLRLSSWRFLRVF